MFYTSSGVEYLLAFKFYKDNVGDWVSELLSGNVLPSTPTDRAYKYLYESLPGVGPIFIEHPDPEVLHNVVMCQMLLDISKPPPLRPNASVHHLFYTMDAGVTWASRALPWQAAYTGLVTAIDTKTLICPVYENDPEGESGIMLYESEDLGETWTKRGVVYPDFPDPNVPVPWSSINYPTFDLFITEFGVITYLGKQGNFMASATPGAPWVTDSTVSTSYE